MLDAQRTEQDNTLAKRVSPVRIAVGFVVAMSTYAYIRLSSGWFVMPAAIALLSFLEVVRLVQGIKERRRVQAACEAAYFLVLLSLALGVYRNSFAEHRTFMFTTVLYRPYYTLYCNRRVAVVLGVLIVAATLPITSGIVAGPGYVWLLTVLYASMVAALWVFCSKLGAKVFRFAEES